MKCALHKKVDQLTRKVDKLSKALAEQGVVKGASGARKTGSTAKTAAKAPVCPSCEGKIAWVQSFDTISEKGLV